ncbi:hypothetical protein SAMN06295960_2644 [Paenibacillus aquistagni]|uniref:Uncharacterized protein n=1 Tax=Paenibacillus aquistagni TaxID=1852522 RepID=A0A1X7KS70_9BACL|nr:hypothetical protein SAMN06295960_2644 [Paenibacillus aquistagni]
MNLKQHEEQVSWDTENDVTLLNSNSTAISVIKEERPQ